VLLTVVSCLMLLPLVFLVSNGFKTPQEMLAWPPTIIPDDPTLANFASVLRDTPLLRWIGNSLVFAVLSSVSILATSAIAGYILAKFPFRSLSVLFMVILATAIVPFEVYMIPLYFQAQALGLLNTTWCGGRVCLNSNSAWLSESSAAAHVCRDCRVAQGRA
jgi:multiple sugar transport system permease protein